MNWTGNENKISALNERLEELENDPRVIVEYVNDTRIETVIEYVNARARLIESTKKTIIILFQ